MMLYSYVDPDLDAVAMLRGHLINLTDLYFKNGPYNLRSTFVTCNVYPASESFKLDAHDGVTIANNDFDNFTNVLSLFAGDFISMWAFCEFYDVVCNYKKNHIVTDNILYRGLLSYCTNRGIKITWG